MRCKDCGCFVRVLIPKTDIAFEKGKPVYFCNNPVCRNYEWAMNSKGVKP